MNRTQLSTPPKTSTEETFEVEDEEVTTFAARHYPDETARNAYARRLARLKQWNPSVYERIMSTDD